MILHTAVEHIFPYNIYMVTALKKKISSELTHIHALSRDMKHMLVSYACYLAAYPLLATFMNAYLWRTGGDLWGIILYNTGWIVGLPIGFYLNGIILHHVHLLRVYFMGLLLQAVIPLCIVFLPFHSLQSILLYGLAYGLGSGLFWGNKSYIDQQITRGTNRLYYNSLGSIADMLANILVPATIGWSIEYINHFADSASFLSYKLTMLVAFVLLVIAGSVVQSLHVHEVSIQGMLVRRPSKRWWFTRFFDLIHNIQVGVTLILANVVILVLVGSEGALGTVQTITAALSSLMLYVIGRKATHEASWKLVAIGSLCFFAGTLLLAANFAWIGAVAYSVVITIAWAIQWPPATSVIMDVLDHEEVDPSKQYAYICDSELFYNIGRGIGIGIAVVLLLRFGQATTLRFTPFIVGIIQLPLAYFIYRLPAPSTTASTTATGESAGKP